MSDQFQVGDKIKAWGGCWHRSGWFLGEALTVTSVTVGDDCLLAARESTGAIFKLHPRQCELIERKKPEPKYVKVTMYQPVRTDGDVDVLSPKVYPTPDEALNSPATNMRATIGYAPIEVWVKTDE